MRKWNAYPGFNVHRLDPKQENHKEVAFAETWMEENNHGMGKQLVEYLIEGCSFRDEQVVATIIQWLGSDAGQGFLKKVEEKINKK